MNPARCRYPTKLSRQRGVAAIEFAVVAILFLLMLFGLSIFGQSFNTKQVLSRAATDGARAVSLVGADQNLTQMESAVRSVVVSSLLESDIAPKTLSIPPGGNLRTAQYNWLNNPQNILVRVQQPSVACTSQCYHRVEVGFNYNQNYVPQFTEPPPPPGGTPRPASLLNDLGGIQDSFISESAYVKK